MGKAGRPLDAALVAIDDIAAAVPAGVEVVVVVVTMVVQMPTLAIEETGGTEETEETEAVVLEAMLMGVAMAEVAAVDGVATTEWRIMQVRATDKLLESKTATRSRFGLAS